MQSNAHRTKSVKCVGYTACKSSKQGFGRQDCGLNGGVDAPGCLEYHWGLLYLIWFARRAHASSYSLIPFPGPSSGRCVEQLLWRRCGISGRDPLDNGHNHDSAPCSAAEPSVFSESMWPIFPLRLEMRSGIGELL